jgi:hypothetical protein
MLVITCELRTLVADNLHDTKHIFIVARRPFSRQLLRQKLYNGLTSQLPENSNKGTVFSLRSVPKCYNQDSEDLGK